MEAGLLPPEPVPLAADGAVAVDPRGWPALLVAMVLIAFWSLRPSPAPRVPDAVPCGAAAPWMVDALPGIGPRTRDTHWRQVRAGHQDQLPARARETARQVFSWPATSSGAAPAR